MTPLVGFALNDGIATLTMDDGKVNALSPTMTAELLAAFDRAEREAARAVVLTGRPARFSAGFDLRVERAGWPEMMIGGARVALRMLTFPRPVVVASTGHAIAMGAFLLLAGDHRIGVSGEPQIALNEVAIGLTMPAFGVALARHRLAAPWFDRCTITSAVLGPDDAVRAGFLDELVDPADLAAVASQRAHGLAELDPDAHLQTKLRVRADVIAGVQQGIGRIASGAVPF